MSSRQEQKRQRREEREAKQRAAEQAGSRGRLAIVGAVIAGAIAIAVVVVLVAGSSSDDAGGESQNAADATGAAIPAQKISDFDEAVKASGCTFKEFPSEGATHQAEPFDDYKTNPPTSGTHNPEPAADGIYAPGNSPEVNNWVHTLEHGRIIIQYAPGTPKKQIDQLTTLAGENVNGAPGYHMVLLENNSKMPFKVAAVSWTRTLGCDEINDTTFDALRVFRDRWVDKAPEAVP